MLRSTQVSATQCINMHVKHTADSKKSGARMVCCRTTREYIFIELCGAAARARKMFVEFPRLYVLKVKHKLV